jgi:hypothetical protein
MGSTLLFSHTVSASLERASEAPLEKAPICMKMTKLDAILSFYLACNWEMYVLCAKKKEFKKKLKWSSLSSTLIALLSWWSIVVILNFNATNHLYQSFFASHHTFEGKRGKPFNHVAILCFFLESRQVPQHHLKESPYGLKQVSR